MSNNTNLTNIYLKYSNLKKFENDIKNKENKNLDNIISDVSCWINSLIQNLNISNDNFFELLQSGIVLCQFGNALQSQINENNHNNNFNNFQIKYIDTSDNYNKVCHVAWRENIQNFINWCRLHKLLNKLF